MSILPVEDIAYWTVERRPSGREVTEMTFHGHYIRTLFIVLWHFLGWRLWAPKEAGTTWHEVDKIRVQDGVVELSLKRYVSDT